MKNCVFEHQAAVARVLAIYNRALPHELAEGLVWYDLANTFCQGLAKKYNLTIEQAAGITATLSPQVSWKENQRLAETLAKTGKCGALKNNVAKAKKIRRGADVIESLTSVTSPNTGHKVRSFYRCIVNPDTEVNVVCVDRHAFAILLGKLDATNKDLQPLNRKGMYEACVAVYVDAAKIANIKPWQMQAVTWVVWRNLKRSLQMPLFGGLGHDMDWSEEYVAKEAKALIEVEV